MAYFSIGVVALMVAFSIVAIVDILVFKEKFGLGEEFRRGFSMMGPVCMAIVGIIALVPILSLVIENTISPLYASLGLDPSMAVTAILANDMGGFQLAASVALDDTIGRWAGLVYGSMMGATIVFSIPVGLAAVRKEDVSGFSKGILYGIASIPVGTFVGGLIMGIPFGLVVKNLIIPIIFSAIIVTCLALWPKATAKVFAIFSEIVNIFAFVGLALAVSKDLVLIPLADMGLFDIATIPVINMIGSTSEGIAVAGIGGLVLSGTLPFIAIINKVLKKPFQSFSEKTGISEAGVTGFLLTCANNLAMFATLDKMKEREKIANVAFAVCAAFVIGDHLAFTAANDASCIAPMMAAKFISGIVAVTMALFFTRNLKENK